MSSKARVIPTQPFDYESFRRSCAAFATGITVTTVTGIDGSPQGLTANSFTSVSWDPPIVLICVDKRASVYEHFSAAKAYAIHILGEDQQDLSVRFASPGLDRFDGLEWQTGEAGAPVLEECLSVFECEIEQVVDAGDHTLFLGAVRKTACREGRPLVYFNSAYRLLD